MAARNIHVAPAVHGDAGEGRQSCHWGWAIENARIANIAGNQQEPAAVGRLRRTPPA